MGEWVQMQTNSTKCFKTTFQKASLSVDDDELRVDGGVDWYGADGGGGGGGQGFYSFTVTLSDIKKQKFGSLNDAIYSYLAVLPHHDYS